MMMRTWYKIVNKILHKNNRNPKSFLSQNQEGLICVTIVWEIQVHFVLETHLHKDYGCL